MSMQKVKFSIKKTLGDVKTKVVALKNKCTRKILCYTIVRYNQNLKRYARANDIRNAKAKVMKGDC